MIPIQELNALLMDLNCQSAQAYRAQYGEIRQVCIESPASQLLLLTMLEDLLRLFRNGGDLSTPLVLLAGTMLQTGYTIGRKHAEAEVLEGWLRL
jgi:hypothetical protein